MPPRVERPWMPDYGVPTELDGALPWAWAEERLERLRNFWVANVDGRGHPHATPVWGIWIPETERFWFSCAPSSLKARNLSSNPHIVVAGDDSVEVVSIEGTAARDQARPDIAARYATKYEEDAGKQRELATFVLQSALFEVTPARGYGLIERPDEFSRAATRWTW